MLGSLKASKRRDGDTITVLDSNKVQHRVRLAGIDAPEKGQPFGNASGKRLGELVARKDVRVEFNKHYRTGASWKGIDAARLPHMCKTPRGSAQITDGVVVSEIRHEQSPRTRGGTVRRKEALEEVAADKNPSRRGIQEGKTRG
jgi:hypothetical protein